MYMDCSVFELPAWVLPYFDTFFSVIIDRQKTLKIGT